MLEFAAFESPYPSVNNNSTSAGEQPEILDLFNKSFLRHIFERLFGSRNDNYEMKMCQVVPRYPDELCPFGAEWHIDFTDTPTIKDSGQMVANFDSLVLILLTESHGIDSGELCTFPSSHRALAKYYTDNPHMFEILEKFGNEKGYPPRYQDVIGDEAYHCLGRAGDVFILNYMNAHYGNCNNSPYIRNAVYFRVWGSTYPSHCREGKSKNGNHNSKTGCGNQTSMLDPMVHWEI